MRGNLNSRSGVGLGLAGEPWQLRQPGADEGDRELPLHGAMEAGDQRLELAHVQELDFVEEEGDPGLAFLGGFASATRRSVRSSLRLPLSAVPSSGSMSIPAVIEPSGATVSEKDLSGPAACRSLSVQELLGATWKRARRTMLPIRGPKGSFLVISAGTVIQPLARARFSNAPSNTVLPTARDGRRAVP